MTKASRLSGCPQWFAIFLFALVGGACLWSAFQSPIASSSPLKPPAGHSGTSAARTDIQLYQAIARRVSSGESYYAAAADEQRLAGYPVQPMQAIRLPTLAWFNAALGERGSRICLALVVAGAILAWWMKLSGDSVGFPSHPGAGAAAVAFGLAAGLHPSSAYSHEVWSGTFVALSLAIHRPGAAAPAIVAGAFALLLRELALPFVLLMAVIALWNCRWRELGGWLLVCVMFAAALWFHYRAHAAVVLPSDAGSAGWFKVLGFAAFIGKVKTTSILGLLPDWALGPAAILALVGWAGWRGEFGLTGSILHLGYAVFYCLFGRSDNYYWGFVSSPTLMIGLLVLPAVCRDFIAIAVRRKPERPSPTQSSH